MTSSSNKALQRRMRGYGLTHNEAVLSLRTTLRAIADELLEGKTVVLHKFGTFQFQLRMGRTLRNHPTRAFSPPRVQRDSWCLKFKVSDLFRKQLKEKKVIPVYGRIPKPPSKPRT